MFDICILPDIYCAVFTPTNVHTMPAIHSNGLTNSRIDRSSSNGLLGKSSGAIVSSKGRTVANPTTWQPAGGNSKGRQNPAQKPLQQPHWVCRKISISSRSSLILAHNPDNSYTLSQLFEGRNPRMAPRAVRYQDPVSRLQSTLCEPLPLI